MNDLKVVIDTNVLVSILKGGPVFSTIYTAFKKNRFKLILSTELLKELSVVLYRPRLKIEATDIKELFRLMRTEAIRVKLPAPFINACRDPKDNFLLELAVISKADFIVTGDEDLLVLDPFRGIPIITAKDFIGRLKE